MLIYFSQVTIIVFDQGGPSHKAVGKEDAQTYSPANTHPRKKLCLDSRKTPTLSLLVITFWHNQKGFWRIQTLHKATRQISFHQHFTFLQLQTTVKFLCTISQFIFKMSAQNYSFD